MRALLLLFLAAAASAARLAPLLTHGGVIPDQYIVKLKAGEDVDKVIATLDNPRVLFRYSTAIRGFAAQLTEQMVEQLRKMDAVEYIEEDGVAYANDVASWGLDRIDQLYLPLDDQYFQVLGQGAGTHVYVLDTGINSEHVDYQGRVHLAYDAVGGTGGEDCNGHGSHCAGTIGGTSYGVAKMTDVYAVRVLNCVGSGTWAQIIDGCDFVATNANHPAVASMSIGGGQTNAVDDAVQGMIDAGVTVSVSAGNDDHSACLNSPANAANAITVGATDITDTRAYFSNYGHCVDIFGPGVSITSAWIGSPTATNTISGTSMSCPHVAGSAAVLLGNDDTLTPYDVKDTLQLKAVAGVINDPEVNSPNLLLYIGEGDGGGFIPTDPPPTPPPPGCGGYFNESSGVVTSPNYPADYGNRMDCHYLLQGANDNDIVFIDFDFFLMEGPDSSCPYDYLEAYDGEDSTAPLIGTWCSSTSPGSFGSSGPSMYLYFHTDGSVTETGFSASYFLGESGECGHTFTSTAGFFTSPDYPDNYPNSAYCGFSIVADPGQTITLSFSDFDVEDHISCTDDAVEVFDGPDEWSTRIAVLCGNQIPEPVTATSGEMYVLFTSDSSLNYKGFSGSYTTQ